MAFSWDEFRRSHEERKNTLKGLPNITIYGSYFPPGDLELLRHLKKILIDDGYKNTTLVIDRQGKNDDALEISRLCLEFSDINLFVFTRTGKGQGVVDELAMLTMEPHLFSKVQFSKVFYQIDEERSSVPSLTRSRIFQNDISHREFGEPQELEKVIVESTYWLMIKWVKFKAI